MFKRYADLVDGNGAEFAKFNETCHDHGITVATVRLQKPFTLTGTESLQIYGTTVDEAIIAVQASDPASTEIREFHGKSSVGCLPDGAGIALVKNPGGDLSTLLIVLAKGTLHSHP
jgi:hypothetical protein